jgi:hypothetical protein
MKKQVLIIFLQFIVLVTFACKCPQIEPITKDFCKNYDVIFYGKVDSIVKNTTNNGIAYFSITSLYKGKTTQHIQINYDATSSCMMSFSEGDEWLIYAYYEKYNFLRVNICQHSRKHFKNEAEDYYRINAQRSFEEEKLFLQDSLGIQVFIEENNIQQRQQNQISQRNIQPEPTNKLLLLVFSLASMGIIFYLIRKKQ